jgi:hypothetical protein
MGSRWTEAPTCRAIARKTSAGLRQPRDPCGPDADDPHQGADDRRLQLLGRKPEDPNFLGAWRALQSAAGAHRAIVFTAGIGEHSASLRERVCRNAAWLGVELDPCANAANGPRISIAASRVTAWVIPTDEEVMIARHTRNVLTKT